MLALKRPPLALRSSQEGKEYAATSTSGTWLSPSLKWLGFFAFGVITILPNSGCTCRYCLDQNGRLLRKPNCAVLAGDHRLIRLAEANLDSGQPLQLSRVFPVALGLGNFSS